MIIGLAGAHRSGKSTLAQELAEQAGIAYYDGSFGRLAKTFGYNSVAVMTPFERITMQFAVLERFASEIREQDGHVITDRTPVDMLAYMMAEVGMHAGLDEGTSHAIVRYRERCLALTSELFDVVLLLQPLPTYQAADGKPSGDPAYQMHIQTLIEGGILALRDTVRIAPVDTTDRTDRIHAGLAILEDRGLGPVQTASDDESIGMIPQEDRSLGFSFGPTLPYLYRDFGRGYEIWHRLTGAIVWRDDGDSSTAALRAAGECRRRNAYAPKLDKQALRAINARPPWGRPSHERAQSDEESYGVVPHGNRNDGYSLGLEYPYVYGIRHGHYAVWHRTTGNITWLSHARATEPWGSGSVAQHAVMVECYRQNRVDPQPSADVIAAIDETP